MEEAKSFSLQSPERIAKLFGGNKQKILQALQSGALQRFAPAPMDQLLATAAANFIDQMRDAAQAEAVPQQTVFQKTFAPPVPQMPQGAPQGMPPMPQGMPAGLGATPEAAAMPAPAEAMMGVPGAQAVPGMAEGGMVPPYASGGGLSDLPVPDGMFDEPSNGGFGDGYRGGGLVAFATGEEVEEDEEVTDTGSTFSEKEGIKVMGPGKTPKPKPTIKGGTMYVAPTSYFGGLKDTLFGNAEVLSDTAPRETKRAEQLQAYYDRLLSPEEREARRKEALWAAVGKAGRAIASTPGSLTQAVSAGLDAAGESLGAATKGSREEERAVQQALAGEERTGNKEMLDRANIAIGMLNSRNDLNKAFQENSFRNELERLGINAEILKAKIMAGAGIRQAVISAMAQRDTARMGLEERRIGAYTEAYGELKKGAILDRTFQSILKAKGPVAADLYLRGLARDQVNSVFGSSSGGGNTLQFDSEGNLIQ